MVYVSHIEEEKGDCVFEFSFDTFGKFTDKDVFYILTNLGVFQVLGNMGEFARNKHSRINILKRTKDMDKKYRLYKKMLRENGSQ